MRANAKIYILHGDNGLVKVGHSTRVEKRIKEIRGVAGIAHLTEIKANAELIERTAHRLLKLAGKHVKDEWFSATVAEALEAIERAERIAEGLELGLDRMPPKPATGHHVTLYLSSETIERIDRCRRMLPAMVTRTAFINAAIDHWIAESCKIK